MILLAPKGTEIIEIGLTVVDLEKREIVKSYSYPISYSGPRGIDQFGKVIHYDWADAVSPDIESLTG